MLDEASFTASPAHRIPDVVSRAASGVAGKLRDLADGHHPD